MAPKKSNQGTKQVDMSSQPQPTKGGASIVTSPLVEVRNSPVHGRGVFAAANIKKGTRLLEYLGDRVSHDAADKRYEDHDESDNHTFLFIVDKHTVIDAGVGGNAARFINHQCDGNCESVIQHRRVFIDATRDIAAGAELGYDYEIGRDKDDPPNVDEIYACRCGSAKCRGSMLEPAKKKRASAKKAGRKPKSKTKPKAKRRVETRARKSRRGSPRRAERATRRRA